MPDGGGSERSARSASKSRVSRLQQQQQNEIVEKRSTSVPPKRMEEDPNASQACALPRRTGSLRGSVYKSDLVSAVGSKLEVGSNSHKYSSSRHRV